MQKTELKLLQLPPYISMAILPDPVVVFNAFSTRIITVEEFAVKLYHISSSADDPAHAGELGDAVAVSVLVDIELEQLFPKGVVFTTMAPAQSSLGGGCALIAWLLRKRSEDNNRYPIDLYMACRVVKCSTYLNFQHESLSPACN
jgi:hypothetical protein